MDLGKWCYLLLLWDIAFFSQPMLLHLCFFPLTAVTFNESWLIQTSYVVTDGMLSSPYFFPLSIWVSSKSPFRCPGRWQVDVHSIWSISERLRKKKHFRMEMDYTSLCRTCHETVRFSSRLQSFWAWVWGWFSFVYCCATSNSRAWHLVGDQ